MLGQDIRFGLRMLRKNPGFTMAAVLALTLGVASTTAIFTVVDGVLLRSLPYPHADQIVTVSQTVRSTGISTHDSSPANYLDWVAQNDVFSKLAASRGNQLTLSGGDQPERIHATTVTANFFELFGVSAVAGRTINRQDATSGNDHVAVLGYELWQRRFGGQRDVIGTDILLDSQRFTVVGVMPRNFSPDDYGEIWLPSAWDLPPHPLVPNQDPRQMRDRNYLDVWGRLKPGVTLQQARIQMSAIAARLEGQYPSEDQDVGVVVTPLGEEAVAGLRGGLLILMGAVAFLLLIGCVNVANLLLARSAARDREIAIRFALGASRARLMRQLLTESVMLAVLGGAVGVLFAAWGVPILLALGPADIQSFHDIGLNRSVLGFSLAISVVTGLLFGSIPALFASFRNPNQSLIQTDRSGSHVHRHSRSILMVAEVALSFVLLIGAGLMFKSFLTVMRVHPGFASDHLLVFNAAPSGQMDAAHQTNFYRNTMERIAALPGVTSVGAVNRLPLAGGNSSRSFMLPGSEKPYDADLRVATPDYFRTMKIPVVRGRVFADQDRSGSADVALINEALARMAFPNEDPIGKYIVQGPENKKLQIIGVVGNVRHAHLETSANAELYRPLGQMSWPYMFITIRTATSNPLTLLPAVQNAVWSVDKNVALANTRTMEDIVARSVANRKFIMLLLITFAGMALILAAIGLFGVLSYSVVQRAREIGVRMALGARRLDIFNLIVKEGMLLTAAGLVIGIGGSIALTRLIASLLFGVTPTDFSTFALLSFFLAAVAFLACWWPARKASHVDPVVALRTE